MSVESNISQVTARLRARAGNIQNTYEAGVVNNTEYAAAVDQGSTRKMEGLSTPQEEREAASAKRHTRYGEPKWQDNGLEVTRGEDWTEIITPPAGMMAKSIQPMKAAGKRLLKQLPPGFDDAKLKAKAVEMSLAAQSILVDNTPVDESVLVKGWVPTDVITS